MARKILCVAEKPAIAKSVAQHLSGGQVTTVSAYVSSISTTSSRVRSEVSRAIPMLRTTILISTLVHHGATAP